VSLHSKRLTAKKCAQTTPLEHLDGLTEALGTMESFVLHATHVDAMLLYRGMAPLRDMLGGWALRERPGVPDAAPPVATGVPLAAGSPPCVRTPAPCLLGTLSYSVWLGRPAPGLVFL
jgi:hypothetical protein